MGTKISVHRGNTGMSQQADACTTTNLLVNQGSIIPWCTLHDHLQHGGWKDDRVSWAEQEMAPTNAPGCDPGTWPGFCPTLPCASLLQNERAAPKHSSRPLTQVILALERRGRLALQGDKNLSASRWKHRTPPVASHPWGTGRCVCIPCSSFVERFSTGSQKAETQLKGVRSWTASTQTTH
jgi:hypothetical protein